MKVRIYQINKELDTENTLFMGFDFAEKHGGVDPSTYSCVFDGSLDFSDIEEVYALCNAEHPIGYNGHSFSVSDIVEIDDGCYFCDSIGFKKLADFDLSKVEPLIGRHMVSLLSETRKNREPLLHCAVFIELRADSREKLSELQTEISMELAREKITVDRLTLRQLDGFRAVSP